jgi:hypothetical protein
MSLVGTPSPLKLGSHLSGILPGTLHSATHTRKDERMSTYANDPAAAGAPDLAALLGGGSAAPPDSPDTGSSVTSAQKGDNSDNLRHAIMFIQAAMEGETDDQTLAELAKCLHAIQAILANEQKLTDQATGAGPGARVVRRATAAAGRQ